MITLSPTPILETERLTLRAPTAEDWPVWRDFSLSDRAAFVRPPEFNAERSWRAFAAIIGHWTLRSWGSLIFTLKDQNHAMGMVGPWCPEGWPEPEILWMIWDPVREGEGYVAEATRAAIDYAFGPLGWKTAVSYIDPGNTRSIQLAERLGARLDPGAPTPMLAESPEVLVYRHSGAA